jgi:hypothetical protein
MLISDEYHSHPAVGSTSLKRILRSPAHYRYEQLNPSEPTPAMQFGTICHTAILEPQIFFRDKVIMPTFSGAGARTAKEHFLLENHGKIIVTPDQMDTISGMLDAISKHESARQLLSGGVAEESYFDVDPETGILRKVRPDYMRKDLGNLIIDVKTTTDASPQAFAKCVANLMYHLSAALYLDVVSSVIDQTLERFVIVAIEKDPPFGVAVYMLDERAIEAGRFLYQKALRTLKECRDSKQYPAYPDHVMNISIPSWAWPVEE